MTVARSGFPGLWRSAESGAIQYSIGVGRSPHEARFLWSQLPNTISMGRILASPVLLVLALSGRSDEFKWLLLACLISDTVDGAIARAFKLQSQRGAFLDSTADVLNTAAALVGLICLHWPFVAEHRWALLLVAGLYVGEVTAALWRYGRVSSFHTYLARAAAYAQGIFVMSLFFLGYSGWLFYTTVVFSVVAYVEEILLLYLLPRWTSDVRGLFWALTRRRAGPRLE